MAKLCRNKTDQLIWKLGMAVSSPHFEVSPPDGGEVQTDLQRCTGTHMCLHCTEVYTVTRCLLYKGVHCIGVYTVQRCTGVHMCTLYWGDHCTEVYRYMCTLYRGVNMYICVHCTEVYTVQRCKYVYTVQRCKYVYTVQRCTDVQRWKGVDRCFFPRQPWG